MDTRAQDQEPGANAPLAGLAVVAFESRMAAEAAALIERQGARAIVAPSMREVPIASNPAALEFARRVLAGEIDVVIFLTGVGTRALFAAIEGAPECAAAVEGLKKTVTLARGPKPVKALREYGVEPTIIVREPNTWREVLAELAARVDIAGKRIAVQEYGVSNPDLTAGLEARGAAVTTVPVYRWTLPEDLEPLRAAVGVIAQGTADMVLFTSQNQVVNVLQVAQAQGVEAAVRRGLESALVASIGPVCSEALRAHGIGVDLEPRHPKLGHLIKETGERGPELLRRKRERTPQIEVRTPPAHTPTPAHSGALRDHPFLRACRREPVTYTPVWLMRQAGRYMPEYRRVRERHSFLEMCQRPELAAEVTVTAVERLGVDAAIIFADILLPLVPMGVGLHYEKGDGPVIDRPIRRASDLAKLPAFSVDELGFVGLSIRLARGALAGRTPLIGFAGAPFTLASYLIEGGASRQYLATKTVMYQQPQTWDRLMAMLARVTADYLNMQIEAGADAVQLFDSWVGSLGPDDYRRFVLPHMRALIEAIRPGVPVIHFGTITGNLLELMREAGGDVIGLDWRVNLAEAWERLGPGVAVQGNLDPVALFAPVPEIRARARAILDLAAGRVGHIFNLGHGILPETPVEHVIALVEAVHEMSQR